MSQYSVHYGSFAEKQINPVIKVLPEPLYTKDIHDAPKVISCHHQAHIRTGPF